MIQSNVMDFTSSCNAKTQNNAEGLRKGKLLTSRGIVGVVTQKKNNCLNSWADGDTIGDIEAKQST